MINQQSKLKLQAYLDNELSEREARELAAWLEQDAEARGLYAELKGVRTLLEGNELEVKLPESREFYWSKIEKAIRASSTPSPAPKSSFSSQPWWARILAPALGMAVLLMAALSLIRLNTGPSPGLSYLSEIESARQDMNTISFHSQSAGVTVVWVQSPTY